MKKNDHPNYQWKWVESYFSNLLCMLLNPSIFPNSNSNCSNLLDMTNLQEQVKKGFCFKNWSDLSVFEWIILVISKILQIFGLQPRSLEQFLFTVGQNNFGIIFKTTHKTFQPHHFILRQKQHPFPVLSSRCKTSHKTSQNFYQ